jgi:hypothetical protein
VPTDLLVADIDGDGRADILTLAQYASAMDQREGRLVVRLQAAPGVFAPAQTYVVGIYPWKMALEDIDGDGAPDLVITDDGKGATISTTDQSVWMLLQDKNDPGTFQPPQRLDVEPSTPYVHAVGDVSGDGVPDIVVSQSQALEQGATLRVQDANNRGELPRPGTDPDAGQAGPGRVLMISLASAAEHYASGLSYESTTNKTMQPRLTNINRSACFC